LELWSPLFFTQESGALNPFGTLSIAFDEQVNTADAAAAAAAPTAELDDDEADEVTKKLKIVRTIPLCSKERLQALRHFSWEQELASEELSVSIIVCSTNHSIRLFKGTGYVDLTSSC